MTCVSIGPVDTKRPGAVTWVTLTFVHILGAVKTRESIWTDAGELLGPGDAGAFGAGCRGAGVQEVLTVLAGEPNWSFRAHAGVVVRSADTCGTVQTWR